MDYIYKDDKNKWIVVIDPQGQISFNQSVYQNPRLKDKLNRNSYRKYFQSIPRNIKIIKYFLSIYW